MELILFTGSDPRIRQHLLQRIQKVISGLELRACNSLESLLDQLRQYCGQGRIVLLLTATIDDLLNVLLLSDRLEDVPVVLILPDRKQETFTMGSRLLPRYISYSDSDFKDVCEVLDKMIQRLG